MNTAKHVGQRIRERRRRLNLSQEAVGAQLGGMTQQAISKMEHGSDLTTSQLVALAKILDVPVGYFFDGLE